MKFMNCTSCQAVVQINNTGTCLGCQRGFVQEPQEDAYQFHKEEEKNANEVTSTKEVDARQQTRDGKKVGSSHSKRKKSSQKSKEEK